MTTWADDKERELFEAQETIAELLEALQRTLRWLLKAPNVSTSPKGIGVSNVIEQAEAVIRKASR